MAAPGTGLALGRERSDSPMTRQLDIVFTAFITVALLSACSGSSQEAETPRSGASGGPGTSSGPLPGGVIAPGDLSYLGAFRLPGDGWAWGGLALTYYPGGDASGPSDGAPGSLFGAGFNLDNLVSEISIPEPVLSRSKNLAELNTAETLQDFADLRLPVFRDSAREIPRIGLAYLDNRLYHCWGQHFEDTTIATHTWSELDLANPGVKGPWRIEEASFYSLNDYMFAISQNWAGKYTNGRSLATGRYRDGGWSGQGPSLYAIDPWNEGSPPAPTSTIGATVLLQYDRSASEVDHCTAPVDEERNLAPDCTKENQNPEARTVDNYHHSDEWSGAEWLSAGDRAAVIFVGTKGTGDRYWYGTHKGPCFDCGNLDRGWYSAGFAAQILFYDPAGLARVAQGEMDPSEPQPYATLNIDDRLFSDRHMLDHPEIPAAQQKYRLGGVAYDPATRRLYIIEQFADGEKPIVHVWQITD